MITLKIEQIMSIHRLLLKQSGGLDGLRDNNLLESALQAPFQTFDGEELYSTIQKKAACLCFGLINNHGFIDGNKRVGILAMMIFLQLNGMQIDCSDEELILLGLGVASGNINQEELVTWIMNHTDR